MWNILIFIGFPNVVLNKIAKCIFLIRTEVTHQTTDHNQSSWFECPWVSQRSPVLQRVPPQDARWSGMESVNRSVHGP